MRTVLVIEDKLEIRENTCELLELQGYEVIFAADGKAGLAMAKKHTPDIILCDIPDAGSANGYEGWVCRLEK